MIKLVQGRDADRYPGLIDQMFRLRAKSFSERLGWDVKVVNGWERDEFDGFDPLYVLALNASGKVVGSARLLQTTGPNMLAGVFSELLPEGTRIRSPLTSTGLSPAGGEIMISEIEIGMMAGLSHIVTVVDVRMERILRRSGCSFERLAPPVRIGRVLSLAGLIAVNSQTIKSIRTAHGLDPSAEVRSFASDSVAA
jgi:acyl homoserine lactone synthase